MLAVEMLTTADPARAENIAEQLDACNRRRQEVEQTIVGRGPRRWSRPAAASATAGRSSSATRAGTRASSASSPAGWPSTYHRPSIVDGPAARTSARAPAGRSPASTSTRRSAACSDGLLGFGGHPAAAGLRMAPAHFDAFAERFDHHCRAALTDDQQQRKLDIDAEVRLGELSLPVVEWIETLEPYGIGNPRPILVAEGVRVVGEPRPVGERQEPRAAPVRPGRDGRSRRSAGTSPSGSARLAARHRLCGRVPAVDQRVERAPRGPAGGPRRPASRRAEGRPCPLRLTPTRRGTGPTAPGPGDHRPPGPGRDRRGPPRPLRPRGPARRRLGGPRPADRLRPDDQPAVHGRPDDPGTRRSPAPSGSWRSAPAAATRRRSSRSWPARSAPSSGTRRSPSGPPRAARSASSATRTSTSVVGDGTLGWPEERPFDRIIVTAAAPELPEAAVRPAGRGRPARRADRRRGGPDLHVIERRDGRPVDRPSVACRFVPLLGREGWDGHARRLGY